MIRKATLQDLDAVVSITLACAKHMCGNGIFQWNDNYPNRAAFKKDIEREELLVFEKQNGILGCVVRSPHKDDVYNNVTWLTKDENNLYIHRLAVQPNYQGQGIAQQLMDTVEQYARTNSFKSIRLDTFSQNSRNQKFYELRGYKQLEAIYFPNQSEHPFYCYELVL
ncbi:GNAT family N-acetyltransferase [Mangrovimonas xylaniphaga]|uniref:GNAT family N-acetyltransferase n=1 Tax=Mangrovimonas xylaniphaga TaxID=1645915 RepID=UPI0006B4F316|nr:GNAT family N-acetyltransferase [Mangrovimonas xylaniphaga]